MPKKWPSFPAASTLSPSGTPASCDAPSRSSIGWWWAWATSINKRSFFTPAERVEAIRRVYAAEPRVTVEAYDDLTADLALRVGARFVLRGIRSVKDFEYERDIAGINHRLSDVETVLLFTEPHYADISSTVVRELLSFGKDVSAFLPAIPNNIPKT